MKVEWHTDYAGRLTFSGHVDPRDLGRLKLDRLDRAVVTSPVATAADLFLTLEILFRRMAEDAPRSRAALDLPAQATEVGK